jgi:hypothetical protein
LNQPLALVFYCADGRGQSSQTFLYGFYGNRSKSYSPGCVLPQIDLTLINLETHSPPYSHRRANQPVTGTLIRPRQAGGRDVQLPGGSSPLGWPDSGLAQSHDPHSHHPAGRSAYEEAHPPEKPGGSPGSLLSIRLEIHERALTFGTRTRQGRADKQLATGRGPGKGRVRVHVWLHQPGAFAVAVALGRRALRRACTAHSARHPVTTRKFYCVPDGATALTLGGGARKEKEAVVRDRGYIPAASLRSQGHRARFGGMSVWRLRPVRDGVPHRWCAEMARRACGPSIYSSNLARVLRARDACVLAA